MKKDLKELISYVFVGGCTTLINFVIYWFVITMMDQGWLFANVISWVGAVIFAFWANKHFVFKSANETGKEAYQFFILRLGTLLVESGLLFIFIQLLSANEMLSKVVVSVITVVSNYGYASLRFLLPKEDMNMDKISVIVTLL